MKFKKQWPGWISLLVIAILISVLTLKMTVAAQSEKALISGDGTPSILKKGAPSNQQESHTTSTNKVVSANPAPPTKKRTSKGAGKGEKITEKSANNFQIKQPFNLSPFSGERYDGDPYVTSEVLTSNNERIIDGDTMYFNESYKLRYEWELPNDYFTEGDVVVFTIPKEFVIDDTFDFAVNDQDGQKIGLASVRGNNEDGYRIEMTMTDYVERYSNVSGYFELEFHLNETYIKEGPGTIHLPDQELTVTFPKPPDHGNGGGGDGTGAGNPEAMKKLASIEKSKDGLRYVEWSIQLGREALLGQVEDNGTISQKFDSFDDIEHVYITDEPVDQRLIAYSSLDPYWSDAYGWYKTFWSSHPFDYGSIPEDDMGLIGSGPDYHAFKIDLIDQIKQQEKKYEPDGFRMYEFQYFTEPLDRFEQQDLVNEAVVTIVGKDGENTEYRLENSIQWNTGEGGGVGSRGSVILKKVDEDTNEALEDAVFDLYKVTPNGPDDLINLNLVTNSKGEITVSNLKVGDYYFEEKRAPIGYELPEDNRFEFSITSDNIHNEVAVSVLVDNKRLADRELSLTKVDESGNAIGNSNEQYVARFHLEYYKDNRWQRVNDKVYETNKDGQINLEEADLADLPVPYDYRFKEVKAPYGFELPDDPYTDVFHVDKLSVEPNVLTKVNKKLDHQITLEKTIESVNGSTNATSVEGMVFVLQRLTNNQWYQFTQNKFTTDKNGQIKITNDTHPNLIQAMIDSDYEQFRFREYSVPERSGLQDPQFPTDGTEKKGNPGDQFSVSIPIDELREGTEAGRSVHLKTLKLENKWIRYALNFTKKDSVNGDRLKGAEFTLMEKDNPNAIVTSKGENSIFTFDDLIINQVYFIKETKAPEGYGARSEYYELFLDLDEKMHVSLVHETGKKTELKEGTDFTWDGQNLKLDFDIKNTAMPKIPNTGGWGITIYALVGISLVSLGSVLYHRLTTNSKQRRR